jgi:hypothetical protein
MGIQRDPTYEDLIYLTIMIFKSWTISTLFRNLGYVRIISKVSGLGAENEFQHNRALNV